MAGVMCHLPPLKSKSFRGHQTNSFTLALCVWSVCVRLKWGWVTETTETLRHSNLACPFIDSFRTSLHLSCQAASRLSSFDLCLRLFHYTHAHARMHTHTHRSWKRRLRLSETITLLVLYSRLPPTSKIDKLFVTFFPTLFCQVNIL